jgi:alcohol dehydrogenase (cytochrome c)
LNLLYWGIGNPGPDWNGDVRPGDNLFTCSLLAIDAASGKIKWHFQFTPHDTHDWDANEIPVLLDAEVNGRARKLVVMANRNAFYYVLDRETGEFLHGTPYAKQTWAPKVAPSCCLIPNRVMKAHWSGLRSTARLIGGVRHTVR